MIKERKKLVVSGGGICYYVVHDAENSGAGYGIYAETEGEEGDAQYVRKVFFTEEEAVLRCRWLCENQVYPVALFDTLRNIF